ASQTTSRGRARISSTIREVKRMKRLDRFCWALTDPQECPLPEKRRFALDGNKARRWLRQPASEGDGDLDVGRHFDPEEVAFGRARIMLSPRGDHGREEAAVVGARPEPVQRLQVFGNGVAFVGLKAVARTVQRQ